MHSTEFSELLLTLLRATTTSFKCLLFPSACQETACLRNWQAFHWLKPSVYTNTPASDSYNLSVISFKYMTQRSNRSSRSRATEEELQRRINYESPSKYDLDFYQRKVNRLENDLAQLQDELGLARFRLHKAEDFEIKYELLVKQNQTLAADNDRLVKDLTARTRELEETRNRLAHEETLKVQGESDLRKSEAEVAELKRRLDESKDRGRSELVEEKAKVESQFNRQIDNLRSQHKDIQTKLEVEIGQLKDFIASKVNSEETNAFRLEKLRKDKNDEILRLNELVTNLRRQITDLKEKTNDKVLTFRNQLNQENKQRVQQLTTISQTTQNLLMKEVETLRATIISKNSQIDSLLALQRNFMEEHEQVTNELKAHIRRLQDKIFEIHRQNQLELFSAIERLKAKHDEDLKKSRDEFKRIENQYEDRVRDLNFMIDKLKEEMAILERHLRQAEADHHKLSKDKEALVSNLSQQILKLEEIKEEEVKTIGASLKLIEEEAESKLRDLHHAMLNKNEQFEIMKAQLALKNKEISHLLDEMHKLRNENRDRVSKLEDIYSKEAELLNEQLAAAKKENHELKRRLHELRDQMEDTDKENRLQNELKNEENLQLRESNQRMNRKNEMIREYVKELEDDLKIERTRNVDFVQDTNVVRRDVVQEREKVRGELEAIKEKELEQMRNIFNIDLNKLRTENTNLAHKLRDKIDQYQKLLNDFKDLEGKLSDEARGRQNRAEDLARKKATLECEIHLTRNVSKHIEKVA